MKNKKEYMIVFYTILALLLDLSGRIMAEKLMLPIWCDSIGTFLMAYVAGPVCGGVVGFTNNIIYGIFVEQQSVYCVLGTLIGVAVGYLSKKKVFETQFKTMTLGMGLAVFSTFIAVIINVLLYDGTCGNIWGDQVMLLCMDSGFPKYISYLLGQFCVEFLDKLICVEIVFWLIKVIRNKRNNNIIGDKKRNPKIAGIIFAAAVTGIFSENVMVMAGEPSDDYDSYVQIEYSNEEGLLSGEANDIEQTKDGKLWIGTYAGLFKYDGSKFARFNDIPSVKNVNCLYVDEEGRLWTGTNDDGITIFINEHVMNVIDEENGLLSNYVNDIVSDSNGNYYIGTTEGIALVSLSGGVKITKSYDQIKNVICMSADQSGTVVGVTDRGEIYWLRDGEIITSPIKFAENKAYRSACFTEDNRLLLGTTDNDVLIYDMTADTPYLIREFSVEEIDGINSFYVTDNNELFICSDTGVVVVQKDLSCKKLNTNNFMSSINNMLIDYQGNLWFSSSRLGLLEMCKSPFVEVFSKIGEESVVNTTEKWQGLLFCGTDDGLIIVDENRGEKVDNEISELLLNTEISCIKADSHDNLWIATTGMGVYKISVKSDGGYNIKQFTEDDGIPGMRFHNICEAKDGTILIAGDYGAAVLSDDFVEQVFSAQNGLVNEKSLCLLEYKNAYYIGSDGGGITKVEDGEIVRNIGKKDGLSSDVILRMIYDPSTAGVFIVTSNGLCYMSSHGQIKSLDQFPYSNNYDMVCDEDGTCWVLGSSGIYVAKVSDLLENTKCDYPLVDAKRGFRSSLTANAWLCRDGDQVYLCCDNGVVKINMSKYDMTAKSYRMILDHVEVDGAKYEINRADTFKLSSQMGKIVFEPEVLNYSMNDPYVSYFLEGYDTGETVCLLSELGKVEYADLKSGTYVFRISILDGIAGNVVESASYTIEKDIEMYQKGWFKLYVLLIAGLVLVWVTWFITRTQTQKTLLKHKYELEYAKKQIQMGNETILSIARTVDAKDTNTSKHSFRVSEYSVAIARKLGYSEEKCENLRQMALLHDIGKIGIPDAILNKPGKLTDKEYEIMKSHVIKGGEILKDFTMIDSVDVGALYHHEKYDGTGYCQGLKGEEIPLDARIIGIADAFDAMTANRVYRNQLDIDVVIAELKRFSGIQFDPALVDILLSLIEDGTIDVTSLYEKSREGR